MVARVEPPKQETRNTVTLAKAGVFHDVLENAIRSYSRPLGRVEVDTFGNSVKYFTYKPGTGEYLLMVSQQNDGKLSTWGYNVLFTVTSYHDARNEQIARRFEKETGIPLNVKVPDELQRFYAAMSLPFEVFERKPEIAKMFLEGRL